MAVIPEGLQRNMLPARNQANTLGEQNTQVNNRSHDKMCLQYQSADTFFFYCCKLALLFVLHL